MPAILVDSDGPVATLTLNRPERQNAIDLETWRQIDTALRDLAARDHVRCLIIRGAGDRAFCAGHDLSRFEAERSNREEVKAFSATVKGVSDAICDFPRPTIAMIHGYCMGAGVQIAVNCDIRIAAESSRIALTPKKVGLYLEYELIDVLVSLVGIAATQEIVLEGRTYTADDAKRIGLVNRVIADGNLESETRALAVALAGRDKDGSLAVLGLRGDI